MAVMPAEGPAEAPARPALIDCDLHVTPPSVEALFPYLDEHWREYISTSAFKGPPDSAYPKRAPTSARPGSTPANGVPGSDLALLREQVLDPLGVEVAILACAYGVESIHNPDAAAAIAAATNDWLIAEWLEREPRLRASIVVPSRQPDMAAREIERVGGHPGVVQVFLPVRSEALYGNRRYHPIYAAATRHDLVIGLHFGGAPGNPPTPSGWLSSYLEDYVNMASVFQSQLLSLVVEGAFERFPRLRVTLLEGGFTWLPAFLWRADKEWKGLRREIPWSHRLPSATVRERVRLTLQPVDAPPEPRQVLQVIEALGSDELLLYASDYPHRHATPAGDGPPGRSPLEAALGTALPAALAQKIMAGNARTWYRGLSGK